MEIRDVIYFKTVGVKTTATITEIERSKDRRKVYVRYTVNGTEIEKCIGDYSRSVKIGEEINIYVSELDPQRFRVKEGIGLTAIIRAIVPIAIGIFLIVESITVIS